MSVYVTLTNEIILNILDYRSGVPLLWPTSEKASLFDKVLRKGNLQLGHTIQEDKGHVYGKTTTSSSDGLIKMSCRGESSGEKGKKKRVEASHHHTAWFPT